MQLFTGMEYLKIDIAGSYGLDKKSWNERLDWFNQNESKLESLYSEADSPAMYIAGVQAYRDTKKGIPTGYLINLDCTHSGLQILSVLTGDVKAAELCNVIGTKRNDSYTLIFDEYKRRVPNTPNIDREIIKKAIMTSLYASTKKPKELLGEDGYKVYCDVMSDMAPYCWSLNEFLLMAWNPNVDHYQWTMPDGFHVHIPVEDVEQHVTDFGGVDVTFYTTVVKPKNQGRFLSANLVHSIDALICREMVARTMYDFDKNIMLEKVKNRDHICPKIDQNTVRLPKEQRYRNRQLMRLLKLADETKFFSMRILDFIDESNIWLVPQDKLIKLIESLPEKPFELLTIHDNFRCHPNYGNDVRRQFRNILQEVADSEMLSNILSDMLQTEITNCKAENIEVTGEYCLS